MKSSSEKECVVKLIPPKLTVETVQDKLACTRPVREGCPNISLERIESGKSIVHCYGHGGSGWTLLFGSVNMALSLFLDAKPSKDDPVRIVGAGCIGLMCAVELSRLGYKVAGITANELVDLPSWKAAGYFALVSMKTSPEYAKMIEDLGVKTFVGYRDVERGFHPYLPSEAVKLMPVYCSRDTESGVEYLAKMGLVDPIESVTLDFGGGVQHKGFLKYMTYFINGPFVMHSLHKELKRLGVRLEKRPVRSFDEFKEPWIFDCSGLGARELNNDRSLTGVKGHLITLEPEAGVEHMEYMIHTNVMQNGKQERIYMFPKSLSVTPEHPDGIVCAGVLGGTFLPEIDIVDDTAEYNKILNRCSQFFYGRPF